MGLQIRGKVTILSFSIAIVVASLFSVFYYYNLRSAIEEKFGASLEATVNTAAISIQGNDIRKIRGQGDEKKESFKKIRKYLLEVMRQNNLTFETLYAFRVTNKKELRWAVMLHPNADFVGEKYQYPQVIADQVESTLMGAAQYTTIYENQNGAWVSAMAPIRAANGAITGILQADFKVSQVLDYFHSRFQLVLLALSMILLIGLLLSLFLSGQIVKPLKRLTQAIQAAQQGDFSSRVAVKGNDEISNLAVLYNSLVNRLTRVNSHIKNEVNSSATLVNDSAHDVHLISERLKNTANEQAAEIEEATAALNNIHEVFSSIQQNAQQQREETGHANKLVTKLNREFESLHSNVNEAYNAARTTSDQI